jgi:transcriptional regulator with XRE-family HTH domain
MFVGRMDTNQILKTFGENLKKIREAKGKDWTQNYVADMVGVGEQHLSKLERGLHEPGIILTAQLAQVLGCKIDDLIKL